MLTCVRCGKTKPECEFRNDKHSATGKKSWCRSCPGFVYVPRLKHDAVCVVCGQPFLTRFKAAQTCGKKCRDHKNRLYKAAHYRERHPVKMITIACKQCGRPFSANSVSGTTLLRYCSVECRTAFDRRAKYHRTCVVCGQQFVTSAHTAKTCGEKCLSVRLAIVQSRRAAKLRAQRTQDEKDLRRDKVRRMQREYDDDERARLADRYVRRSLYCLMNRAIPYQDITPGMIELRRLQILVNRKLQEGAP